MESALQQVYENAMDRELQPERYFTSVYADTDELWGHIVLAEGPNLETRARTVQSLLEQTVSETPELSNTEYELRIDASYVRCRVLPPAEH